jgi:Chromo (CHRromatin Organisation MOdifier) domain
VIAIRGKNAYELELPKSYSRIHLTFHVTLLEPYQRREGVELPELIKIDGEDEWEVERILDTRVICKKRLFLMRWKGYTRDNDLWEPEENVANANEAVESF